MTQLDRDREAFERRYNEIFFLRVADTSHCNDCEVVWNAALTYARDHFAPRLETLRRCGLTAAEVSRLKIWFDSQAGRDFPSFWEEAFSAGVNQAKDLLAPKLTENEAAIVILDALLENMKSYEVTNRPYGSKVVNALRTAGMRFKGEA